MGIALTVTGTVIGLIVDDRLADGVGRGERDGVHTAGNGLGVQYMGVTREIANNRFADKMDLQAYSRGAGGFGLPGDLSSASRFVRAAFVLNNSVVGNSEKESVTHFFHILGSVAQQKGCCAVDHGYEYTIYSSCCNTTKGIYYYTTYENSQISAVDMHKANLDGKQLVSYPLVTDWNINKQN